MADHNSQTFLTSPLPHISPPLPRLTPHHPQGRDQRAPGYHTLMAELLTEAERCIHKRSRRLALLRELGPLVESMGLATTRHLSRYGGRGEGAPTSGGGGRLSVGRLPVTQHRGCSCKSWGAGREHGACYDAPSVEVSAEKCGGVRVGGGLLMGKLPVTQYWGCSCKSWGHCLRAWGLLQHNICQGMRKRGRRQGGCW